MTQASIARTARTFGTRGILWVAATLLPLAASAADVVLLPYGHTYRSVAVDGVQQDAKTAPFGSGGVNCPIQSTVASPWPLQTRLVVKTGFVATATTNNVRIRLAVDNDARISVNGTVIGTVNYAGCPALDNHQFTIPAPLLLVGRNVVQVISVDRGTESFFDMTIVADDGH